MNGAIARIILRYIIGMALMSSPEIGETLAMDSDIVLMVSGLVGLTIEGFYVIAKKRGWTT